MYKPTQQKKIKKQVLKAIREGSSIDQIHGKNGIASKNTLYKWLNKDAQFRDEYARAREQQALFYAEKIEDVIADLKANDKPSREVTDIARLEIDSLKWIASKLLPKVYGNSQGATNIQINNIEPVRGMQIVNEPMIQVESNADTSD